MQHSQQAKARSGGILLDLTSSRQSLAPAVSVAFAGFLVLAAAFAVLPAGIAPQMIAFAALAALTSWWANSVAAGSIAVTCYFFISGFVEGQMGSLTWAGQADVLLIGALVVLAVSASIIGRKPSHRAYRTRILAQLSALLDHHQGGTSHG